MTMGQAVVGDDAASIWRNPSYVRLWLSHTVTVAGTAVTRVVVPVLIYQMTGSAALTALFAAFEALPYLLFGLPAGVVADRIDRRKLMIGCELLNGLLVATIPVAALFGSLHITHVLAVGAASASLYVWFDAASFAVLPSVVGRSRLPRALSLMWTSSTVAYLVAPTVAGVALASVGAANAIGLDAMSYLVSGLILFTLTMPLRPLAEPAADGDVGGLLARAVADVRDGLRHVWRVWLIRTMTLLVFGMSLTGGAVLGLLVVYAVRAVGLAPSDGRIALLYVAGGVGSLSAALVVPGLMKRQSVGRIACVFITVNAAALAAFAFSPGLWPALASLTVYEFTYSLVVLVAVNVRQLLTSDQMQGRVNATGRMVAWAGQPIGAIVGGLLADQLDVRLVIGILAVGVAASATAAWVSPLRTSSSPAAQAAMPLT